MTTRPAPSSPLPADPELPEGALEWVEAHLRHPVVSCERMPGAAGARRYWRARGPTGDAAVLMWALPESAAILPPALRNPGPEIPFLEVADYLRRVDVPVPDVYASDASRRWVLLEDLGTRHLGDLRGEERRDGYTEAIDLLARVHGLRPPEGPPPLPFRRQLDAEWIRFELGLFESLDWSPATRQRLGLALPGLVSAVERQPRVLSLRDYQSQNLMLDPRGRLRVIDFQDALLAPAGLDLAALLWDSYRDFDPDERASLLERYAERAGAEVPTEALAALIVQRKCKDLSRFHMLIHQRGDERYTPALGRAAASIREAVPRLDASLGELGATLLDALREAGA